MIYPFRESLLSQLYPGFFHSSNALKPAIETFEARLDLPHNRRHKIIWRLDSGFGGDKNVLFLLRRGYQFIVKGLSNRRAANLAQKVKYWRQVDETRFVGRAPTPASLDERIQTFVIRTHGPKNVSLTYLLTNLKLKSRPIVRFYDQRGAAETEFRTDKSGGGWLHKRRKHKHHAQEVWVHLTDMAHNYLAWFSYNYLSDTSFSSYGQLRITRDLFRIPGFIEFDGHHLISAKLLKSDPHSEEFLEVLRRIYE